MKFTIFAGLSLSITLLIISVFTAPAFAQGGASVATSLETSTLNVGDEVRIAIDLDLHGAPSRGGYIDIVFDPTLFACVEVENTGLFGSSEGICPETGLLRITSRPQRMSDIISFASPQRFAVVRLQAIRPAAATAVHFIDSSQIFGTRGGDILVQRDDSATRQIVIEGLGQPAPVPPGSGGEDPPAVPEPASLLLLGVGLAGIVGLIRRKDS